MFRVRRLPALIAAITLVAAGLSIGQPTTASAAECGLGDDTTPPVITGYGPTTVTLGLKSKLVTFSIKATDDCGVEDWMLITPDKPLFFAYGGSPKDTVFPFFNELAGSTAVDAEAYDADFNVEKRRFTFRLLRHARWQGMNAGPEPVRKSAKVTVRATLQRADWDKGAYVRYGSSAQRATVQFRAKGSSTWRTVKTARFGETGRLSAKVWVKGTTKRDGWYRVRFAGNGTSSAATSPADYVDVR